MLSNVTSFNLILRSDASIFLIVGRMSTVPILWIMTVTAMVRTGVAMRMVVVELG